METLSHPSDKTTTSSNEVLVELLQESIEHVQADQHHAVLYQALAALHEYIGCQQQRLVKQGLDHQENHHQQQHEEEIDTISSEEEEEEEAEILQQSTADSDVTNATEDAPGAYTERTLSDEFLVDQSVEVEVDDYEIINTDETTQDKKNDDVLGGVDSKTNSMGDDDEKEEKDVEPPKGKHQQGNEKLVAEEKMQELEKNVAKAANAPNASPPSSFPTVTTAKPAPTANLTPELRVEQQKKLAIERRRQDLELQRKLARVDQRRKDLQQKRKFLEQELRKQELMAKQKAAQHTAKDAAAAAANSIRSIQQQLVAIDAEIQQTLVESTQLKAEIAQRKNQPLPSVAAASSASAAATNNGLQQRRLAEQARKEKTLEEQKKAAAEKRRLALEEQRRKAREDQKKRDETKKRRFLEQEQRKQELMANAKKGSTSGHGRNDSTNSSNDDAMLLRKLSSQMTALDAADEERKRVEDAKKKSDKAAAVETEFDEAAKDPEIARNGIAEQARQKQMQDTMNDTSSPPSVQLRKGQQVTSPGSSVSGRKVGGTQYSGHPPQSPNLQSQYQPNSHKSPQTPPVHHQYRQHPTSPQQNPADPHPAQHSQHRASQTSQNNSCTGTNQKYSIMATSDDDDVDETNFTELKRKIIVGWALQPPNMASLRSIDQLLQSVQAVYPPFNNVPVHSYFDGWQEINHQDLIDAKGTLDEKKLSKAVRKLRFFLHPDKLPRDLTEEHHFMVKLLWDVTNDAWEDYKKVKDELDWMNG